MISSYQRTPIVMFMWTMLLAVSGCGYGKVDIVTYEYAKALYTVCNQQDETRLEEFAAKIAALTSSGEMPTAEAKFLEKIIDQARAGEWEAGMLECRKMMESQTR